MGENLSVEPLTTNIGARLDGIDIRDISAGQAEAIRNALDEHGVIVFSGQQAGLEDQKRLAEVFGPLEPLPTLKFLGWEPVLVVEDIVKGRRDRPASMQWGEHQGWHTDSTFTAQVPRIAVLRPEIIPPTGGGTSWTSLCAAYDDLSQEMQNWLSGLRATHAEPPGYREAIGLRDKPADVQRAFEEAFPPLSHPIVIRHPRSGRRALFVNPTYTVKIEGLSHKESRHILNFLFNHIAQSDFVYRHRWRDGDIVVWDELVTLHLAPDDYAPHKRRVVRVTAGLETPTAAVAG
ncbi:MAG: TauD/TfdA family dioxygenase [Novosphingobium sp.]|nr:TauD/TfdA family dioxygenase [Novosphingobium sp.]MCP5404081.1 TauD/TfdA family dioxygenase [Novosphingobium sp.]